MSDVYMPAETKKRHAQYLADYRAAKTESEREIYAACMVEIELVCREFAMEKAGVKP